MMVRGGGGLRVALLWVCVAGFPAAASAQIISPGKLASVHTELEGIRGCTQCHELRKKGISPELCLSCHEPLARRIAADSGFHATLAEPDCATCHRDHFGEDFDLVRLDTLAFQHDRTGYVLEGRHEEAGCRECHTAELIRDDAVRAFKEEHEALTRTFLGLPTSCDTCHESEDPHGDDFPGRACAECHDPAGWEEAGGFDHDDARYALTGRHRTVSCEECHEAPVTEGDALRLRFRPVAHGSCTSCHEDPHEKAMEGRCETCHTTADWQRVDPDRVDGRFDHSATEFELVGSHDLIECAACHEAAAASALSDIRIRFQRGTSRRAFPRPERDRCSSCHVDTHDGVFTVDESVGDCIECHQQTEWLPSSYGLAQHNSGSVFALDDAHMVVPCATCHRSATDELLFEIDASTCLSCHGDDDAHAGQFEGRSCDSCHAGDSFSIPDFPHQDTRYPLDGAHIDVECSSCHLETPGPDGALFVRYTPLGTECRDCHEATP